MKTCKVCGAAKDADQFSGRLLACKPCRAAKHRAAYAADPAPFKRRSAAWKKENPEKVALQNIRNHARRMDRKPDEVRALWRKHGKLHRERHPERDRARDAVSKAVARGRLVRPETCSRCGGPGPIEFDHTNGYDRAHRFVGQWVCKSCHWEAELQRRGVIDG
jgi:hypothetical protein